MEDFEIIDMHDASVEIFVFLLGSQVACSGNRVSHYSHHFFLAAST